MGLSLEGVILAIILGTLAAIVYSLRILVLVERRIARIDLTLMTISDKILKEEVRIERAERKIESYMKHKKK